MAFFENISLALGNLRSNKMRSLLTMLGIIIGIAAVIAIVTVGNSMTGSVTDSMSGMGVSNITVTIKQKTSGDTQGTAQGVTLRRFMDETPGESDRITDAMIRDFYAAFPDKVDHFEYTVDVGQETISKYGNPTTTIKASVSGVNHDTLANKDDDSQILYGRWLDDAKDAGRMLACVSEKFVTQAIGGSPQDAIGKSFTLQGSDGNLYTYFIVGVYKYTEDSYSSMFGSTSDDDIQTDIYIPLDVARTIAGTASGYQSFTVVAANGVDGQGGRKSGKDGQSLTIRVPRGTLVRDAETGEIEVESNNAGGILGGISTGAPVMWRMAVKPTPSIGREQQTVDMDAMENAELSVHGRHDPCIVPRAVPVAEAAAALAIWDALLEDAAQR